MVGNLYFFMVTVLDGNLECVVVELNKTVNLIYIRYLMTLISGFKMLRNNIKSRSIFIHTPNVF